MMFRFILGALRLPATKTGLMKFQKSVTTFWSFKIRSLFSLGRIFRDIFRVNSIFLLDCRRPPLGDGLGEVYVISFLIRNFYRFVPKGWISLVIAWLQKRSAQPAPLSAGEHQAMANIYLYGTTCPVLREAWLTHLARLPNL
jgi:hypothetical protein